MRTRTQGGEPVGTEKLRVPLEGWRDDSGWLTGKPGHLSLISGTHVRVEEKLVSALHMNTRAHSLTHAHSNFLRRVLF